MDHTLELAYLVIEVPEPDCLDATFSDVVGLVPGTLDPALVQWFDAIEGSVVEVAGRSDDLEGWFSTHAVRWALQRPDVHLFGTATNARTAEQLLTDLCAQLTDATHLETTP